MVKMDWKTILSFNHEDITDEDKEKIFDSITWVDPGDIEMSFGDMKGMFLVAQEILRYKGEQVQSLTSELDELASKQGEMEAELQLNTIPRNGSLQVKELSDQIEQQEGIIEANKSLIEKMSLKISSLEDQVAHLLKDKAEDSSSTSDPVSEMDRIKELGDSLKKKNGHIKELLSDIQALNEENKALRSKLKHTKEKLSEATFDINNLSLSVTNTRGENKQLNANIEKLMSVNASLKDQVKGLIEINKDQDSQLDEFAEQMDSRINQWKEIIDAKQSEIDKLQNQNAQLQEKSIVTFEQKEPDFYSKAIKQREDQIESLQTKLKEATQDLLGSVETIEALRSGRSKLELIVERLKAGQSQDTTDENQLVERLKNELERCRIDSEDLEECLKIKEAELAEALKLLNKFERGESGLKEALDANRKVKQQLRVRDDHIHQLVAENNRHTHVLGQMQLENSVMRNKLNMSPEQPISTDDILAKHAKRKRELNSAMKKISALEEQKISLQIQLRQKEKCIKKLGGYIRSQGIKIPDHFLAVILAEENLTQQAFENDHSNEAILRSESVIDEIHPDKQSLSSVHHKSTDDEDVKLMKENFQRVVDENDVFRKGLREMFDAIKEQAKISSCDLTTVCLEKLIHALEGSGGSDLYTTSAGLVEGKELRAMLAEARKEILLTLDLLAKESQKNLELERKLTEIIVQKKEKVPEMVIIPETPRENVEILILSDEEEPKFDFTNSKTTNDTYLKFADRSHAKALNNTLRHFHNQFELLYDNMIEIYTQSTAEKNKWKSLEEQYKNEIENLATSLQSANVKFDQIEKSKTITESNDLSIAEVDMSQLNSILGEKVYFERRNKYLEESLKFARNNNVELKAELLSVKKKSYEELKVYEIDCQKFMFHVADLRNSLRKSVPIDVFMKQNEKLNDFEMKYRIMLNSIERHQLDDDHNVFDRAELEMLIKKCELLIKEKEELIGVMRKEKRLHLMAQQSETADTNLQPLATELSDCKTELITMMQKVKYVESINSLLSAQVTNAHTKLDNANQLLSASNIRISSLEEENIKLQEKEMELISKVQISLTVEEGEIDYETVSKLAKQNEQLQLENLQLSADLTSLTNQSNDFQHDKLVGDLEMNILRHQILDLQSSNHNKAIIARLSGEILVSHLHTAEMHKKREKLTASLKKERDRIKRLENIVHEKEMQFDNYVSRANFKISFLSSAIQALREQYQCSIPLAILENIYNTREEWRRKRRELEELETQIRQKVNAEKVHDKEEKEENSVELDRSAGDMLCLNNEILQCPHNLEKKLKESKWKREKSLLDSKISNLSEERNRLELKVDSLEESLLMLTFAFGSNKGSSNPQNPSGDNLQTSPFHIRRSSSIVELTDIDSDDINQINDPPIEKPTPKPRTFVKTSPTHRAKDKVQSLIDSDVNLPGSPIKMSEKTISESPKRTTVVIQTDPCNLENAICQTDFEVYSVNDKNTIKEELCELKNQLNIAQEDLISALALASERAEKLLNFDSEKCIYESKMAATEQLILDKDKMIESLETKIQEIGLKLSKLDAESEKLNHDSETEQLQNVLKSLRQVEAEKDEAIAEYRSLLESEKIEHNKTTAIAQKQMFDMKMQLESLDREYVSLKDLMTAPSHIESYNSTIEKYRGKILELEERCFQLQRDFENAHAAVLSSRSECERWKTLSGERFSDLETLSRRLEEKHNDEVNSYRTEASHWLAELNISKRNIGDLRAELNQGKMAAARQVADRDEVIRRLHVVNGNLKQQVLNLQTIISASDPTFDLSAITELEEEEDLALESALTTMQSHRLDTNGRTESTSDTTVDVDSNRGMYSDRNVQSGRTQSGWPDSTLERVRREKQMLGKQNSLLRKQIRVLGAREKRSRLELQNLKSQLSRSGVNNMKHFTNHEETSFLQRKIEALENQLSERTTYSVSSNNARAMQIALWDKQKRWQETSERWKQRFEEKSAQLERMDRHLEAARTTIQRIEKEKRLLDSRLSKTSRTTDGPTPSTVTGDYDNHLELLLRDKERLEEEVRGLRGKLEGTVTQGSLMERLEAQQRRITSLELADKGKDVLVSEYERLLEQNSFLAKRNLKLESEILDGQLVNLGRRLEPDGSEGENLCCRRNRLQKEHLENYVKLLKEENSQILSRNIEQPVLDVTATKTSSVSQAKRTADLERTVLTLRGLIGGLQAENKRLLMGSGKLKRSPVHISHEKVIDELRRETDACKRTLNEKDELLERAKMLLRKAVEKEKLLLQEISSLKGLQERNQEEIRNQ